MLRIGIVIYLFVLLQNLFAADTLSCKTVMRNGVPVTVIVAGVPYDVFDTASTRKIAKLRPTLDSLKAACFAKDSLLASYALLPSTCSTAVAAQVAYTTGVKNLLEDYKKLYADCKQLVGVTGPRWTLEGGVGLSGPDYTPALLAGVGFQRLRVYSLLQQKNFGLLVGGSYPIR